MISTKSIGETEDSGKLFFRLGERIFPFHSVFQPKMKTNIPVSLSLVDFVEIMGSYFPIFGKRCCSEQQHTSVLLSEVCVHVCRLSSWSAQVHG